MLFFEIRLMLIDRVSNLIIFFNNNYVKEYLKAMFTETATCYVME